MTVSSKLRILEPTRIGTVDLRNRLVMPAMHLGYAERGGVTPQMVAFYGERARGGAGLIVVGGITIGAEAGSDDMISADSDERIEGLRQLSAAIRAQGARASAQLYHAGRYAFTRLIGGRAPLAPSAVASRLTRETPRAMDIEEIRRVQAEFAQAARRCQQAGFDMVEVIASAGYIIAQFLSPLTNQREDGYGGPLEQRMRFGLEVLDGIRREVGRDFPVVFRIGGSDFMPGGNTLAEATAFARALEERSVDAISVTGGWHETRVPQLLTRVPRGAFSYLAGEIHRAVRVPVMAANRINTPELAEKLLRWDVADLICMARPLLADPDLPGKLDRPELGPVLHCIACNQGCFDSVVELGPVRCMVNPRVGHEAEAVPPAAAPRRVVVVGAGPAGLKAASVAAERGHRVTLLERATRTGGQIRLAARVPGREDLLLLTDDLTAAARHRGVDIRLGTAASTRLLADLRPDVLLLATGAEPLRPEFPGMDLPHVVQAWDVLSERVLLPAGDVVVLGGGATGVETALFLAQQGTMSAEVLRFLLVEEAEDPATLRRLAVQGAYRVAIVEMKRRIGRGMGRSAHSAAINSLERLQVKLYPQHTVEAIEPEAVVVASRQGRQRIPASHVVVALGARPCRAGHEELMRAAPEVRLIGDCNEVGNAYDAIRAGYRAALAI
jgi:2,4-dienoyl-CoA reductase (NADPH2)